MPRALQIIGWCPDSARVLPPWPTKAHRCGLAKRRPWERTRAERRVLTLCSLFMFKCKHPLCVVLCLALG